MFMKLFKQKFSIGHEDKSLFISILLLLPAVTLVLVFIVNPIIQSIYLSFFRWKGVLGGSMPFVGIDNYTRVLSSGQFWNAMKNTLFFMIGGFCILMPLSFILALIITSKIKFVRFFKASYFMPVMLPLTAVGLMWVFIFEPNWGVVNTLLENFGFGNLKRNWLGEPNLNIWIVILVNEWVYAGFNMLIFAVGIIAIPQSLYEAAVIDGCRYWQKLKHITIPLSRESFKIFSIMCMTGCLRHFDLVYMMTRGGPNRSSEMPAIMLYNEAFVFRNFGQGNAIGVIILILGLSGSIILNKSLYQDDLQ